MLEHSAVFCGKVFSIRWTWLSFEVLRRVVRRTLMTEAVSSFETSVGIHEIAWHNDPEDSHLHIRRSENLKSYHKMRHIILMFITMPTKAHIFINYFWYDLP
jgi:hypothetical protein